MKPIQEVFAVAGSPILHSKSPDMFNAVFERYLLEANYIRIAASSAKETVDIQKSLDVKGMNVTSPFKEKIIPLLDKIDETAEKIGAVNCVVEEGGALRGFNTDWIGVIKSLKDLKVKLRGSMALVIGAGGAGKAALFGLLNVGARVTLINRTNEKSKEAVEKIGGKVELWENLDKIIGKYGIIVSTIPKFDLSKRNFKNGAVYLDANYRSFHKVKSGVKIVKGEEWLINQAAPAYKEFLGTEADEKIMRYALNKREPKRKENLFLIGFIGSGKTSIGKLFAKTKGTKYFDLDEIIEENENDSIPNIFKKNGENYFRRIEKETLYSIKDSKGAVISCGGGIVTDRDNREIIKRNGIGAWLYSPVEVCLERLKGANRPPLTNPFADVSKAEKKAKILFVTRTPYYCETSDFLVSSNKSPENVVEKIYEEISKAF